MKEKKNFVSYQTPTQYHHFSSNTLLLSWLWFISSLIVIFFIAFLI